MRKAVVKQGRRMMVALMSMYGLFMIVVLLAQWLIGERSPLIAFFNTFAQIFWLPALCLIPLAIIFRSGRSLLLLLPSALAFIVTFGDHFVPRSPRVSSPNQISFTLMTFNMFDNGRDPTSMIALIESAGVDVVAMQELNVRTAAAFDKYFAVTYPYRAFHINKGGARGLGMMSKFPLSDDHYWNFDWMPVSLGHQRVHLAIQGQTLTLYNLHPIHPGMVGKIFDPSARGKEIDALLRQTREETTPFMMVGDFNMPELSEDYAHIVHDYGFIDAYRARGWGLGHTFTRHLFPFLRLDYMFLGAQVDVADIKVWPTSAGSDHRPIRASLVLKP